MSAGEVAYGDLAPATSPIQSACNVAARRRTTKWLVTTVSMNRPVLQVHHTSRFKLDLTVNFPRSKSH